MNKKIKLFCSIFLSVMLFSCSINASASNTSVITTSDIVKLAEQYGFTVQFIYARSQSNFESINYDDLETILSDAQKDLSRQPITSSSSTSLSIPAPQQFYTEDYVHVFSKKFGPINLQRMQFLTTFDWTYFQGYPRFHEAKYVELTTAGLSIHKWVQSSSRANSYFWNGESRVELVSTGYLVLNFDIGFGELGGEISAIFTSYTGNVIESFALYDAVVF